MGNVKTFYKGKRVDKIDIHFGDKIIKARLIKFDPFRTIFFNRVILTYTLGSANNFTIEADAKDIECGIDYNPKKH